MEQYVHVDRHTEPSLPGLPDRTIIRVSINSTPSDTSQAEQDQYSLMWQQEQEIQNRIYNQEGPPQPPDHSNFNLYERVGQELKHEQRRS